MYCLTLKLKIMNEEIQDYLMDCSTQRAGFAAIITGILSIDCTDAEAVSIQVTAANMLMDVVGKASVKDPIQEKMLQVALDFAEKGLAAETAKSIINGGE